MWSTDREFSAFRIPFCHRYTVIYDTPSSSDMAAIVQPLSFNSSNLV